MEVGVFVPIGTGNAEPDLLRALGPAGVRGLLLKRGKQGTPTEMPAKHSAYFDWTYPSDQPEMAEREAEAKPAPTPSEPALDGKPNEKADLIGEDEPVRHEGMDWFVNLRPTMLDDPSWFTPFIETYTSEKLPWAATPAVHSYEKFPSFEAFQTIGREFAESES